MGIVNSGYVSDHTKWIDEQLEQHPEWVADQKAGRALWWEKYKSQVKKHSSLEEEH